MKAFRVAFVSTMYGSSWGGSEELWGGAAHSLLRAGHRVAARVNFWPGSRRELDGLVAAGCSVKIREPIPRLGGRIWNRIAPHRYRRPPRYSDLSWLRSFNPDLVVVCQAWTDDGLEVMEECTARGVRYATIVQAASEYSWPDDARAERLRTGYLGAARCFFVSTHNQRLTEQQIGCRLQHAEVVRNPFSVDWGQPVPWPARDGGIRIACVGRLQPDAKGQDVLLGVLARPEWRDRAVSLTFFGKGAHQRQIERLIALLGVPRVSFGGFKSSVAEIWREHHLLVMPSRKEGLPIVLVEAALCGRPAVCASSGGIPEVIDDGITGFLAEAPEVPLFADAMERAWTQREDWHAMGLRAAAKVRGLVPRDPAAEFARRLVDLSESRAA
jgi:glycosyltransferase involved in cell wall biosynthesis